MTSVFLVGDTSRRWNWGCRATTGALTDLIGGHADIAWRLDTNRIAAPLDAVHAGGTRRDDKRSALTMLRTSFARSWRVERSMTDALSRAPRVMNHRTATLQGLRWKNFDRVADAIVAGTLLPRLRTAFTHCEAVIVNGEGSIIDRRFPGRFKLLMAYVATTRFGLPCAMVNHTADISDPVMRDIAENVYPLLDEVCVRERPSYEALRSLVESEQLHLAADAAFMLCPGPEDWRDVAARPGYLSMYPDDALSFDPREPYICVGGSAAYLPLTDIGTVVDDLTDLSRRLSKLAPVVLTASSRPDDVILNEVARRLQLPLLGLSTPTPVAVDVLGSSDLYVGGRWHPAIMASTGGTPVVLFGSNSPHKSAGLLNLLGFEQPVFPATRLRESASEIVALAERWCGEGDAGRVAVRARARELAESSRQNAALVGSSSSNVSRWQH
jgi:polysaccharide pyruvyl transferase WcaK-like protein